MSDSDSSGGSVHPPGQNDSWNARGMQIIIADDDQLEKQFVDKILDRLLLNCIRSGSASVHVEDGLNWTMNDVEIVEEFQTAVDTWNVYAPANGNYGSVHVDIGGRIIDTAEITNTEQLGDVQMAPRAETQTTVDVFLEFSCVFSPRGNHWKAHFSVKQLQ